MPQMTNHLIKSAVLLSVAAERDLHAAAQRFEAAEMRGDKTAAERLRSEAHDLLDALLDHKATAAGLSRSLFGL
jgi:hypothetical protein